MSNTKSRNKTVIDIFEHENVTFEFLTAEEKHWHQDKYELVYYYYCWPHTSKAYDFMHDNESLLYDLCHEHLAFLKRLGENENRS